ncbi:MAG: FAD-dependent oxidoreductase [bacterium]|nr:FAD-dependent oxidoreductase [bacterium]
MEQNQVSERKNIAIIGSGISGLVCAYLLSRKHHITLYEQANYFGGHTHTIDLHLEGKTVPVDTGFIVFNEVTYPNFTRLLKMLQVSYQDSSMSFSVKDENTGLEYNGTSLNTLFAQRSNLLSPRFYGMIRDILRFHQHAKTFAQEGDPSTTVGEFLKDGGYRKAFYDWYIIPMASAIWSSDPQDIFTFPAKFFCNFFNHHRMLEVNNRPVWKTIRQGSRTYVNAILSQMNTKTYLNQKVKQVFREENRVRLILDSGEVVYFDQVIIATHSDQALSMLADASLAEKEILSSIRYQPNMAYVHTDTSLLPQRKLAWAAWNSHLPKEKKKVATLTYQMNILQNLPIRTPIQITLNYPEKIDPQKILQTFEYHHPQYTVQSFLAQSRRSEINGVRNTYFCGAYWYYGFHEDGVNSALDVVQALGVEW